MYGMPHTCAYMTLVPSVLFSSLSLSFILSFAAVSGPLDRFYPFNPIQSSARSFSQSFISRSCVQGLMQWLMVGMFVFFFGSYAFDLFIVTASPHATTQ